MNEEDRTRIVKRPLEHLQAPDLPQRSERDPDKTKQVDPNLRPEPPSSAGSDRTHLVRPSGKKPDPEAAYHPLSPEGGVQDQSKNEDPIVGWLVIVKGPGWGNAARLGYQWNSIGRDPDQRVCLNYGDSTISRKNHARLSYDPRSRKFMITGGEAINLIYVRGENLLAPTEIKTGDRIQIGETELMLISLCGENFDWYSNQ
jgi:FHA domain-containing protein